MFVEIVGLPGCGKTTLLRAAKRPLQKAGLKFASINKVADAQAAKQIGKTRFLKRYEPRAWIYGATKFAHETPDVFDVLFKNARGDFHQSLWLMDFFTHMHFARQADLSDTYIFLDEGFVHRGAAAFFKNKTITGFKKYLDMIPVSDLIILIDTPVDAAVDRCLSRKTGVPQAYNSSEKEEVEAKFILLDKRLKFGVAHQEKAGADIIRIDGSQSVEVCCERLCAAFEAL